MAKPQNEEAELQTMHSSRGALKVLNYDMKMLNLRGVGNAVNHSQSFMFLMRHFRPEWIMERVREWNVMNYGHSCHQPSEQKYFIKHLMLKVCLIIIFPCYMSGWNACGIFSNWQLNSSRDYEMFAIVSILNVSISTLPIMWQISRRWFEWLCCVAANNWLTRWRKRSSYRNDEKCFRMKALCREMDSWLTFRLLTDERHWAAEKR